MHSNRVLSVAIFTLALIGSLNAESLGTFPASEIFLTQTKKPQSINVVHIKRVNGKLLTTLLSEQKSFNGDFDIKFEKLSSLITTAKVRGTVLEVDQQTKEYFWINEKPLGSELKVLHKKKELFIPDLKELPTGEERAYLHHIHGIVGTAWEQFNMQEKITERINAQAAEVEARDHKNKNVK